VWEAQQQAGWLSARLQDAEQGDAARTAAHYDAQLRRVRDTAAADKAALEERVEALQVRPATPAPCECASPHHCSLWSLCACARGSIGERKQGGRTGRLYFKRFRRDAARCTNKCEEASFLKLLAPPVGRGF
jgi:hypothetical protein